MVRGRTKFGPLSVHPFTMCMLNHCLERDKWVLTNFDHDRQWFNTIIPPSYETTAVTVECITRLSGPVRLILRYTTVDIHCRDKRYEWDGGIKHSKSGRELKGSWNAPEHIYCLLIGVDERNSSQKDWWRHRFTYCVQTTSDGQITIQIKSRCQPNDHSSRLYSLCAKCHQCTSGLTVNVSAKIRYGTITEINSLT